MVDEAAVTTLIGPLVGTYLQVTPNLVVGWLAMNLINLFAFVADPQFHAGWGGGVIAVAALAATLLTDRWLRRAAPPHDNGPPVRAPR